MRKILLILFASVCIYSNAQYNNQVAATLSRGDGYTFPALVHDVSNKAIKHPVFIFVPGRGHNSTDLTTILDAGPAKYLQAGWDGTAINPVSHVSEEYLILNTLPGDYKLDDQYWDKFLTWLYYTSPYKDYIDTNRVIGNGFSAGRGSFFYAIHKDLNPIHKLNWVMMFSPEVNCCDAMDKLVADSVRLLGAGVVPDDSHADQIQNEVKLANTVKSKYAVFLGNPYDPCPSSSGHCNLAWNYWYNPATDTTYIDNNYNFGTGNQINIYQMGLLYSQAPKVVTSNTIVLNAPSPAYCITAVSGTAILATGTSTNSTGSNTYILQLSSLSGSFASPINLGTQTTSGSLVSISGTIPANTAGGSRKVRILNTTTGAVSNLQTITITLAANSIAPTATQNITVSSNGNILTVTNGSTPSSIQWYDGTTPIDFATGTTYIPNFPNAGVHYVTAHSIYNACETQVISNAVTINVVNPVSSARHYVTKDANNGVVISACKGYQYNPGDTFVFPASLNPYSYVEFDCMDNFTVINEGGQAKILNFGGIPGGFTFYNCTNVHFTGIGSISNYYGFQISTDTYRGVGVNVYGRSSGFEIDHLDIHNKNAGMWIKNELDTTCNVLYQFPNWVLDGFNIHDNYVHNNAAEGGYFGSTAPNGTAGTQHSTVYCHGDSSQPNLGLPTRLGNFHVWNNYYDSNGRAAIQLSLADKGTSEINNNIVLRCGSDPDSLQGNGISLGTYTHAYVHDNTIRWTKKDGIFTDGSANQIDNNTVLHSGNDSMGDVFTGKWAASNIFIKSSPSQYASPPYLPYDSTGFVVRNNNLDFNSSGYNVFVETGNGIYKKEGNVICNNTHETDLVRSGINYTTNCDSTLTYTLVRDSVQVTQIIPKHKTFYRDSTSTVHYDSSKTVSVFYSNGKPINRYINNWNYSGFDSTIHFSVPYDSIIYKKVLVDSIIYDTVWVSQAARQYGFNPNSFPDYQLPAFIDTLNVLGVQVLRYPGGIRSDSTDWRTFTHPSLTELAVTRAALNCDIDFVLNMNTSTLNEQIAMLDSAHNLGIPIRYVEFGNEVSNSTAPLRQKFQSRGDIYGDTCKIWAAAIKAKYPLVKFGAWGENKPDIPTWQTDLLSVFVPDALISHLYPNELQYTDTTTGIIDTALFARILNNSFTRSGFTGSIPIWITEYNLSPNNINLLAAGEHIRGLVFMTKLMQAKPEIRMLLMHSTEGAPNGALNVDGSNNVTRLDTGIAYGMVQKL